MPNGEGSGPTVLIAGRSGQVARALTDAAPNGWRVVALGRPELDLAEPSTIDAAVREVRPDAIVNAAAHTAVDRAEEEPERAMAINADGAAALARAAERASVPIVHVSTDYVFDGALDRPYREDDEVRPLGAYGRSKLAGELAVAEVTANHCTLRTAWVYAPYGQNFVRTMLRLAETRDEVRVVGDQRGSPSYAPDLARAMVVALRHLLAHPNEASGRGTFHLAGTGETTWAGLAEAVFEASARRGGPSARVVPIPSSEYPTPAPRPANSRLDTTRFRDTFGHALPDWRDGVERCVAALLNG